MREFSDKYLSILTGELAGLNLTRILEPDEFYYKQIYDSVEPINKSSTFKDSIEKVEIIIDIGFGGGFPILPLAKYFPDKKFIGFEARNKKVEAVNLLADRLDLHNASAHHFRIEDVLIDEECVVTLKAVGKIHEFLRKLNCAATVKCFFYKGPNVEDLEPIGAPKGWVKIEDIVFDVEGTEGRRLLGYERKVPRGTQKISAKNHSIIKLSGIP